jgi:hypothetical protein
MIWIGLMPTERSAPIPLLVLMTLFLAVGCANVRYDQESSPSEPVDSSLMTVQIDADGVYSIALDQLGPAGFEIKDNSRTDLRLSLAGELVPFYLTDSALIFYGRAPNSRYSRHRTYKLQIGEPGERMAQAPLTSENLPPISTISRLFHFEENLLYDSTASGAPGSGGQFFEPWFWQTIQVASSIEIEIELPDEPLGSAELSLALWGVTENHLVGLIMIWTCSSTGSLFLR